MNQICTHRIETNGWHGDIDVIRKLAEMSPDRTQRIVKNERNSIAYVFENEAAYGPYYAKSISYRVPESILSLESRCRATNRIERSVYKEGVRIAGFRERLDETILDDEDSPDTAIPNAKRWFAQRRERARNRDKQLLVKDVAVGVTCGCRGSFDTAYRTQWFDPCERHEAYPEDVVFTTHVDAVIDDLKENDARACTERGCINRNDGPHCRNGMCEDHAVAAEERAWARDNDEEEGIFA